MKKIYRLFFLIPFITVSLVIFFLSHTSKLQNPLNEFLWGDKFLHTAAYLVYGITIIAALSGNLKNLKNKRLAAATLLIGGFYSILDELHQILIPGRFASITDVFADMAGIVLSLLFLKTIKTTVLKILSAKNPLIFENLKKEQQ